MLRPAILALSTKISIIYSISFKFSDVHHYSLHKHNISQTLDAPAT